MATNVFSEWNLRYEYTGGASNDEPIKCDDQGCGFGVYERPLSESSTESGPGCEQCGVISVSLIDVFDDNDEDNDEDEDATKAPECFKRVAAKRLLDISDPHDDFSVLNILGHNRPAVAKRILEYASDEVDQAS